MTAKRFKVYKVIGSFHEWSVEDTIDDKVVFGSIMHKYEADRLCDKLNELAEENEQLKKQLDSEHQQLENAILLERTRMGKNCLKQFREAIQ